MLGTPGRWTIMRCLTRRCGQLWLDPPPAQEDLGALYENYFTHEQPDRAADASLKVAVRRAIRERLLGYPASVGAAAQALAALAALVPWLRASALRDLFWLPARDSGRLLDIGCGNGEPMRPFVESGWNAIGIDADPQAVVAARGAGLDARAGTLKSHRFPDAEFDVVLMSHLIEHLANPLDELKECRRILKPSGSIVIATPNARGLGHRLSGRHWPGLDAPRHLQIFTPEALTRTLQSAGFAPLAVRTHAGISANWMLGAQWWRAAEAAGRPAGLPPADVAIPRRWVFLARVQAFGIAVGLAWGDEIVARYVPV